MLSDPRATKHVPDASFALPGGSPERYLEHLPTAFAVTRGAEHTLVYANAAFRRLSGPATESALGRPVVDALSGRGTDRLAEVLDRAFRTGIAVRDERIETIDEGTPTWRCTVWPIVNDGRPEHLLIEIRETTAADRTLALQREVSERMLLGALREHDAAEIAEESRRRATYLAAKGRQLAESLDERATLDVLANLALPHLGAWCIVDIIDVDGTIHRLAIVHPDPVRQALLRELEGRWSPAESDSFGAPAMLRSPQPMLVAGEAIDAALAAARDPETLRILREIGVGSLLTVPLVIRDRVIGALTFVSGQRDAYSAQDVALAEDLAIRSAMALDSARLHGEALELRAKADAASQAKTVFLGAMSHELRTPLNAIAGYVDLIDLGLRGPVTDEQHIDLGRIRRNEQHLMALISDLLNLVRVGSGRVLYAIADLSAREMLVAAVEMVEPLIVQKTIVYDVAECDPAIRLRADAEKLTQILVNLLSNAIKFTPIGGRIFLECEADAEVVLLHVTDSGIGVPADKIEAIFEPFVQVKEGLAGRDTGVGLGLAISRDLARAMGGDLTVRSVLGEGARFTVSLPRAGGAPADG
jgi:signal transduction histidine kinase